MTTRNAFVLNLNYLKSEAKSRLKQLKQGDGAQWLCVKEFHPRPRSVTPESIRLADIQWVMARELGLASWAALKSHIDRQNAHLKAIQSGEKAPDGERQTLHVRCGHDIQPLLEKAGFSGALLHRAAEH